MNFDGKIIWITGASSGIGLALAQQLAEQGAKIILSSRRQAELESIREHLAGGQERHWIFALDLSKPEESLVKAETLADKIGRIDILINNAGVSQRATCAESNFSVYRQLMEVNYFGTVAMTKAVMPIMQRQKRGHIVAISSVAGKVGSKLRSGYSGSKYAVVGFMDCLRAELAADDIRCLTVCPGSIKTNIAFNSLNSRGHAQQQNESSIENGMDVDQCAQKIIRAIAKGKDEVVIGQGISAIAPVIKRFFPHLFNRMTAKMEYR